MTVRWRGDDYSLHADAHAAGSIDPITGGGSGGYALVRDEGTNLTVRTVLNFTGAGVVAADNAGTGVTDVTIPGGSGTPATSVVTEQAFGQASAVGTSTNYARQDHTHGTMAAPAAAVTLFVTLAKWGTD